ncbi:MAG: response regulator [Hyphomonas sp.]|jgi:FixJ family two-component response regulator
MDTRLAVVDDSVAVRQSLGLLLRNRGYDVETFNGAADLLSALERSVFNILVIDLKLEESNGIALLSEVRRRGCAAPAILITGWECGMSDQKAREEGFAGFVRKPMLEVSILDEIGRICG